MAERTVDQPATVNVWHGHFDGLRGHEDEHEHSGGDVAHPHRNDSSLRRSAKVGEYVHNNNLPKAKADLAAARRRLQGLADAPTEEIRAVVGDDGPGDEPRVVSTERAALVPAGPATNGDRTPGFAELTRIVEHAETQRFEGNTTIELLTILTEAIRQETRRDLVSPDLIDRGLCLFESWAMQRGLREVEAGGGS